MKYRVKEQDGMFYPEYRLFFKWFGFKEFKYGIHVGVKSDSLEEAKVYIKQYIANSEKEINKTIFYHEV